MNVISSDDHMLKTCQQSHLIRGETDSGFVLPRQHVDEDTVSTMSNTDESRELSLVQES
jgi:hypothetical protein